LRPNRRGIRATPNESLRRLPQHVVAPLLRALMTIRARRFIGFAQVVTASTAAEGLVR
jgi:hypothetical protein